MTYENLTFDEERALYGIRGAAVRNCRFDGPRDGESALKEARDILASGCFMNLRYPFWHVERADISRTVFTENCRAAIWYGKDIAIEECRLLGIKALRECENVALRDSSANSSEFVWKCRNLEIENVAAESAEYPFFESKNARIRNLRLKGKYSFQYGENIEISDSSLDTKDAFWHAKNVAVRNSVVKGEYLGWYSENLTLENCRIIGTQPFCYCKNLVLKSCEMENCDLAFERSTVIAEVRGKIGSIKNPLGGKIRADEIGGAILEEGIFDASKTEIVCKKRGFKCA